MFGSYYRPLIRRLMLAALFAVPTYVSAVSTIESVSPKQLIAKVHSATEVGLSWQAPVSIDDIKGYRVFRDGKRIGRTKETFFVDTNAVPGAEHTYYVMAFTRGKNRVSSLPSNSDTIKTLSSDENDGMRNGSVIRVGIARLADHCGTNDLNEISDEALDSCMDKLIDHYTLQQGLEDMQAYVARYRRQEDANLIELGKRLYFSKALSQNYDTSCASCHHPAQGCGSDGLSLSIGVNAENADLMGLGRSDGAVVPRVGRNSPQICNSALWVDSMFWDQRVRLREANRDSEVGRVSTADIQTPEIEVTRLMNAEVDNTDPLRLLMAQAHFPITAPAEMGDPSGFDSPQVYREFIAQRLSEQWQPHFNAAFGDDQISFMRIARAMSAYQASFLFIDNPFFNYIEGRQDKLTTDEKRGAVFFYTGAGCANCHDGVMFTPERTRGPLYPQIGAHGVADGNFKNQFRMPSLLNVGITAPYGDKGVFATLERVIEHYSDVTGSLERFYGEHETCELPQFQHLSAAQCDTVVGEAGDYVLALNAQNRAASDRGDDAIIRGFTQQQVNYLAAFLRALTDPKAMAGSDEINALIPARDGGPDGHQFDAIDKEGNTL
ncbi:cytochrome-c peroxidase [Pseudoalteromonas luteoviolacea]|uniref:cytochrome-c peroxidase n=1 Tax=Pseudoalteromonas luteoviolacea TaxID=43657 RepID=UPI0009BD70EB|nr:cytochrome c peroxidase [Pseudoalteromonas luteoviolacea]